MTSPSHCASNDVTSTYIIDVDTCNRSGHRQYPPMLHNQPDLLTLSAYSAPACSSTRTLTSDKPTPKSIQQPSAAQNPTPSSFRGEASIQCKVCQTHQRRAGGIFHMLSNDSVFNTPRYLHAPMHTPPSISSCICTCPGDGNAAHAHRVYTHVGPHICSDTATRSIVGPR
jgi:hypothetical protein